jgi:hydroxymethylpyrimidine pyrophosphatase-like HAD family hydrolase
MGDYKVVSSCAFNIEIFYKESGKGASLRALAELLGIPIEETIAVGDSTNDKPMLDAAGLSLATENAFPELKAASDEVICHYNDHVAKYILDHYIK